MEYQGESKDLIISPIPQERYHEFRRVSWQWRNLEVKKCFGFGHKPKISKAGEMAYGCASCAQPGVNLPRNWKEDPHDELPFVHILIPIGSKVFTQFLCVDGNFSADHLKQ